MHAILKHIIVIMYYLQNFVYIYSLVYYKIRHEAKAAYSQNTLQY